MSLAQFLASLCQMRVSIDLPTFKWAGTIQKYRYTDRVVRTECLGCIGFLEGSCICNCTLDWHLLKVLVIFVPWISLHIRMIIFFWPDTSLSIIRAEFWQWSRSWLFQVFTQLHWLNCVQLLSVYFSQDPPFSQDLGCYGASLCLAN